MCSGGNVKNMWVNAIVSPGSGANRQWPDFCFIQPEEFELIVNGTSLWHQENADEVQYRRFISGQNVREDAAG